MELHLPAVRVHAELLARDTARAREGWSRKDLKWCILILLSGNMEFWVSQNYLAMESYFSWVSNWHVKSTCISHNGLKLDRLLHLLSALLHLPHNMQPEDPPDHLPRKWPFLNINLPPREATEHWEKNTHIPWDNRDPSLKTGSLTTRLGNYFRLLNFYKLQFPEL